MTARWITVEQETGRPRIEMRWVPAVERPHWWIGGR